MLLSSAAWAWTFDPLPLEDEPVVAVALTGDRVGWLVGGEAVVADFEGQEVARVGTTATALALFDPTRGHAPTALLLCGPDGLEEVQLGSGTRTERSLEPCTAVVTAPGAAFSQHPKDLLAWSPSGSGLNPEATRVGSGVGGATLIARIAGRTALAVEGTAHLTLVQDDGTAEGFDTVAPVRHLASQIQVFYAATDDGLGLVDVYSEQGFVINDEAHRGPVAFTDVNGDSRTNRVTVVGEALSVVAPPWSVEFPAEAFTLLAADRDGAPCSPVAGAGAQGATLFVPVYCGGDADGDGASSEDGDCDDGNPQVGPHAVEQCNAVDDDCNGVIDDGDVALTGDEEVDEGMLFSIAAAPACEDGALPQFDIVNLEGEAWCNPRHDSGTANLLPFECGAGDDGEVTLGARTSDERIVGEHTVTVFNLPPSVVSSDAGEVVIFTSGENAIGSNDLDGVTFTLLDGPRWMVLEPDGRVPVAAPRRGRWPARVQLDDGDVIVEEDIVLVGRPRPVSVTCGTAGGPVEPFGLLLLVALARRRPGGARPRR